MRALIYLVFVFSFFLGAVSQAAIRIRVLEAATQDPIPQAKILIGSTSYNLSSEGQLDWQPESVLNFFTVTAFESDHHLLTLEDVSTQEVEVVLYLEPIPNRERANVEGTVSGYRDLSTDGWIDVSLVATSPSLLDFMAIDKDKFLAPTIPMDVSLFTVNIPRNVDIPSQREVYNRFFPVTLNKPGFQLAPPAYTPISLAGVHVRVPFDEAITVFQNKTGLLQLINKLQFNQVHVQPEQEYAGNARLNMTLDTKFIKSLSVTPRTEGKTGWDRVYATIANWEGRGRQFIPMDLKVHPSQNTSQSSFKMNRLDLPAGRNPHSELLVTALTPFPDNFNISPTQIRVSANVQPIMDPASSEYLPVVKSRLIQGQKLSWQPETVGRTSRNADFQIQTLELSAQTGQHWFVVQKAAALEVTLPTLPTGWTRKAVPTLQQWTHSYVATRAPFSLSHFNPQELSSLLTHASVTKDLASEAKRP